MRSILPNTASLGSVSLDTVQNDNLRSHFIGQLSFSSNQPASYTDLAGLPFYCVKLGGFITDHD